ncbi:MAG: hypothetical protein U0T84_06350 [Chitinophagales bacterium]
MMPIAHILIVGRHANMLDRIVAQVEQAGYWAIGTTTNEGALDAVKSHPIDAVIIGGGVDPDSRLWMREEFKKWRQGIILIDAHPHTVINDLQTAFPGS